MKWEMIDHYIHMVYDTRFNTLNRYRLNCMEICSSVLTTMFSLENMDIDELCFLVRTTVEKHNEENPKDKRVLLFRISSRYCILVDEQNAQRV